MKYRMLLILLAVLLLSGVYGCGMDRQMDALEDAVDYQMDQIDDTLEQAVQPSVIPANTGMPEAKLTKEEAESIALEHAGFTADQVTYLRVEYEIDDGVPQYEVQFHQGRREYDYEINANTGAIMSYDMDD